MLSMRAGDAARRTGNDGGAWSPFRDRMEQLGLDGRMTYLGHVTGERARQVWCAADAYILPSYSEGFSMQYKTFGSAFFTLTGFHGAHVTIGVIWLLSLVVTSFVKGVGREHSLNVEIAGLYWHFVDIVWIIIFGAVYLVGSTIAARGV